MVDPAPPKVIPPSGAYLWEWYNDASATVRRVRGNVCEPIPPSEWAAWADLSGNIIRPAEYAILRAMDDMFRAETDKELAAFAEREKARRETEAAQSRRR